MVVIETGSRWSNDVVECVWQLAGAKVPSYMTQQVALVWTKMLSTACVVAFVGGMGTRSPAA